MARIALDAMGGDFAPQATVAGALLALAELDPSHSIQLVGQTAVVESQLKALLDGELAARAGQRDRLSIIEAPEVIEMTDKPSAVVRGKPNSSMAVGLRMQPDGLSDGFVSAGSTGAQMAASMVILRLHAGLKRPAIVTLFPSARKTIAVLDSGANVDCSAEELVQFARLGATYAECVLGRAHPAVGLLSIGEEPEKGNAVTKETHALLLQAGLNFIGNVEGRDLPAGGTEHHAVDVVVCDGFVGNIILKFTEGITEGLFQTILAELQEYSPDAVAQFKPVMKKIYTKHDWQEYGGAPLLGVGGYCLICHGRSEARAIKNAIRVGQQLVKSGVNKKIVEQIASSIPSGD